MSKKLNPKHLEAWRLFLTTHTTLVKTIDSQLNDADQIPLNWYDVLIELYEAPDRRLRMSDLANRVLLTRSGLTRLVDRLEKADYITRSPDPDDRRGYYASITESGIDAMRQAWKVYSASIQQAFADHINPEEAEFLIDILSRMLDNQSLNTNSKT